MSITERDVEMAYEELKKVKEAELEGNATVDDLKGALARFEGIKEEFDKQQDVRNAAKKILHRYRPIEQDTEDVDEEEVKKAAFAEIDKEIKKLSRRIQELGPYKGKAYMFGMADEKGVYMTIAGDRIPILGMYCSIKTREPFSSMSLEEEKTIIEGLEKK